MLAWFIYKYRIPLKMGTMPYMMMDDIDDICCEHFVTEYLYKLKTTT